jgi:hypothetical protein
MKEMKPMVASSEAQAAVDRLLEAWRGEVQAGLVYQLLAEREQSIAAASRSGSAS